MNSRFLAGVSALALIGVGAVAGGAAAPTPAAAATSTEGCAIAGSSLSWGMKESFRAYISGSIANGSWETSDGADYETPDFLWSDGTGEIDPATGTGSVSFTGTLHFTGHDGVLDLTLANPTIDFEGDGKAALLLDTRSTDMEGDLAVDTEQVWVGEVEIGDELAPEDGTIAVDSAPVALTNSGADAFAGFYEAGEALDPITLTLEVPECGAETAASEPTPEETAGQAAPADSQEQDAAPASADIPWLPIGVGAAALLIIGLTLGLLIGGRTSPRRAAASAAAPRSDGASAEDDAPGGRNGGAA